MDDTRWARQEKVKSFPQKGGIYTVRGIVEYPDDISGLYLVEIRNPPDEEGCEWQFFASRFRPVVERKTDITVFTEILDRVNKQSRETVPLSPQ